MDWHLRTSLPLEATIRDKPSPNAHIFVAIAHTFVER
jgi:hypothetical protein